jgi:hypothetical protein
MSNLLEFNIDYVLSKEYDITDVLTKKQSKNLDIYGKQDFRFGLYMDLLLSLLKVDYLGNNTKREIYMRAVEMARKSGVTALYKIPNTPPPPVTYPYYYGSGDPGLTPVQIQALSEDMSARGDKTYNYTLDMEVYYIAYPASYGLLSKILDINGFETINGWAYRLENLDIDGVPISYLVYEFQHITTQVNFNNTFKH